MSSAILGPGAIGGALAVQLASAGQDVVCVATARTAAAIRDEGLTLVLDGEELSARPEARETLEETVELLIVTVKAPQLEPALGRIRAEPMLVLPLLNGLEHVGRLRERFGEVVAATVGRLEAFRESPTRVVQRAAALVTIAGAEAPRPFVDAGIQVRLGGSEQDVLWEKLARQAPLALLTSVLQKPTGEARGDPRFRAAVEEACAVAAAAGAQTTFAEQWSIIETLPSELNTSTARDVAAGRPSELDAIAGGVVRAGRRLGVSTPTFEELLKLCPA